MSAIVTALVLLATAPMSFAPMSFAPPPSGECVHDFGGFGCTQELPEVGDGAALGRGAGREGRSRGPRPPGQECVDTPAQAADPGPDGLNFKPDPDRPGEYLQRMHRQCTNPADSDFVWVPVGADPAVPVPVYTVAELVPGLGDRAWAALPVPVARIAPADSDARGFAYVQTPTVFWVDQAVGQWAPVAVRASLPGVWAEATAVPERLIVDPGDGSPVVVCEGAPPVLPAGGDPHSFAGCGHIYRDSSAMAPNSQTFPVRVQIEWHVTWQGSDGQSGDLGRGWTTSAVRDLPVAEIQAVVVSG